MTTRATPAPVLVVDDEPDVLALVAYHLVKAGYRVSTAPTGLDALAHVRRERPSLMVLDLVLPDLSGFDILERLREDASTRDLPVLMLTARRAEADRVRGLALGADDYLTKPFSPEELVLRVGAIIRRASFVVSTPVDVLQFGPIRIDRAEHRVSVDGSAVELTPTEFKLLLALAQRRGRVQARTHLLESVWDSAPGIQVRTVDMHIQRLRTKLGVGADLIETVRGFGYRLQQEHSAVT